MQVLVDATAWIDYFSGRRTPRTEYLDELLGRSPIVTADLVLAEVLRGFEDPDELESARAALAKFPTVTIGGVEIALASATHGRILKARGVPVPPPYQRLIASYCILKNVALLHADPAYEVCERHLGLKVPDPGLGY
jgi:predicted nucleic acid-binding protein